MPKTFKEAVIAEIEGTIYFREHVAERYPDDLRNAQCIRSLDALRNNLAALPDDDATLRLVQKTYKEKWESVDVQPLDALCWPSEKVSDNAIFSQYGFHVPESGDAHEFLGALKAEIESWDCYAMMLDSV